MLVTKIQRFSTHDGRGIRTVVFLKGCPLRCKWCHNPECIDAAPQILLYKDMCTGCGACVDVCEHKAQIISEQERYIDRTLCVKCLQCADVCVAGAIEAVGSDMTVDEVMYRVGRDAAFYTDGGGLTVSGGEPMFQPEETLSLLTAAHIRGYNTAIETCGYFDKKYAKELADVCDEILFDVKDLNSARHCENVGVPNEPILEMLRYLDSLGARIRLRCVVIPNINDSVDDRAGREALFMSLKNGTGIDFLEYNSFGEGKRKALM